MKRILFWLILVAVLVAAFLLYRSRSNHLNIAPDSQREIDRAKRR